MRGYVFCKRTVGEEEEEEKGKGGKEV